MSWSLRDLCWSQLLQFGTINRSRGDRNESRKPTAIAGRKRADQVNQDQGTLTSSTLNETVISSSEQQESSIQNDRGDHQENNVEPSESENSLPPQEKPIASTKPTESLQSEQPASEERKALTEKPPHNQEPQNSTLTEKTKEPLVHSEIDNSQEKEKQAEFNNKPRQILLSKRMLLLLSLLEKSVKKHELLVSGMIYTLLS